MKLVVGGWFGVGAILFSCVRAGAVWSGELTAKSPGAGWCGVVEDAPVR